jgi:hypothetical protein
MKFWRKIQTERGKEKCKQYGKKTIEYGRKYCGNTGF